MALIQGPASCLQGSEVELLSARIVFHFTALQLSRLAPLYVGLFWLQDGIRVGAVNRAGMDDPETVEASGVNLRAINFGAFCVGPCSPGWLELLASRFSGGSVP